MQQIWIVIVACAITAGVIWLAQEWLGEYTGVWVLAGLCVVFAVAWRLRKGYWL